MIKNLRELKTCPNCASDNISYNKKLDRVVCHDCGEIFEVLTPKEEEKYEKTHEL